VTTPHTEIEGLIFKEAQQLQILGLQMDKEGVFSPQHARVVMSEVAKRVVNIIRLVNTKTPIKLKVVLRLFKEMAFSVALYSLPHATTSEPPMHILQQGRAKILRNILSLSEEMSNDEIEAQLGLNNMSYEAGVHRLRLLHKLENNKGDKITRKMMRWNIGTDLRPNTIIGEVDALLKKINSFRTSRQFLQMPYDEAKSHLKNMLWRTSSHRWKKQVASKAVQVRRLADVKQEWGPEPVMLEKPTNRVSDYMNLRCRTYYPPSEGTNCKLCGAAFTTVDHLMWECENISKTRNSFMDELKEKSEWHHNEIRNLCKEDPYKATRHILGKGLPIGPIEDWNTVQSAFIEYAHAVLQTARAE
jgi:hypothetical protein